MWAAMIFFQKSEKKRKKKKKQLQVLNKPLTDSSPRSILHDNMGFRVLLEGDSHPSV